MQPGAAQDRLAALTPLEPAQVDVLTIRSVLAVVALLLATMLAAPWLESWLLAGSVALLGIGFILVFPRRRWRGWGYREGEDEIEIRHGRLIRVRTIVPFGRVQHIDVAQGPIQRLYGLGTLILHTAGTNGASVPLPGLSMENAETMRDRIRARIRQDLL
jgi:membrane protein YdbS with pleckstrin-like domain